MGITYKELIRRVFIGFPRADGEARLAVKQAINDAIMAIANLEDASSLLATDTTTTDTTTNVKTYHLTTGTYNLGLTRPKEIYSIKIEDSSNSRKLTYVPHQQWDRVIPYPEQLTTGKPTHYTRFGDEIEVYPIPDAAYDIHIRYSKYPAELTTDASESPYGSEWDTTIVFLSKDLANAYLNGEYILPGKRLADLLRSNLNNAKNAPDRKLVARPFNSETLGVNEYWKDPFIKGIKE